MNKREKQEALKFLIDKFKSSKSIIFTNYQGLTAQEMLTLRRAMQQKGGEYKVVKNTLILIVLEKSGNKELEKFVSGPSALVFISDEPMEVVKTLVSFSKENESLVLLGGVVEGRIVNRTDLNGIASLPSKEQLLALCLGNLSAPLSHLVNYLERMIVSLVLVLNLIKNKQEGGRDGKERSH